MNRLVFLLVSLFFSSLTFALNQNMNQTFDLAVGSEADFEVFSAQEAKKGPKKKQENPENSSEKVKPNQANPSSKAAQSQQTEQPEQTMNGEAVTPNNGSPQTTEKPTDDFIRGY